jgi:hypothetical protein
MSEANSMDCKVGPRAWVIFADNGNCRMWTTFQPHIQKAADAEGLTVTPLFDQAAIDAAVAAERERLCAAIKAADDKASEGDYMLDSDDCIRVIRGTWVQPEYNPGPNAKLNGGP